MDIENFLKQTKPVSSNLSMAILLDILTIRLKIAKSRPGFLKSGV